MTALQLKAIGHYAKENGLRPQLSALPTVTFKNARGEPVTANIENLVHQYQRYREEERKINARERARDRRVK